MGLRDDLDRYRKVGEQNREDLEDFIKYGDLGQSLPDKIKIPIKIIELPSFEYNRLDMGGVGQGDADEGDVVGKPDDSEEGDESGEPGEGEGEHGYYEMDPEEFAEELDEEYELDLEPKGKAVLEEKEGDLTDLVRSGPTSTLDFDRMFKEGLKRKMATYFDADYVREALRVEDWGVEEVYEWARGKRITVSKNWLEGQYDALSELDRYISIEEMEGNNHRNSMSSLNPDHIPFRSEDERYRYPEIEKDYESKVVVVNIRDVSGSMGDDKRDLVERVFTPIDWYLQGKYEEAEFVYIAHGFSAWEVERENFFGMQSSGGTKISSAYELTQEIFDARYPWSEWNRYVFAAGDGENSGSDTENEVIPAMKEMNVNLHSYVEVQPGGKSNWASHRETLENEFSDDPEVALAEVNNEDDVMKSIIKILKQASEGEE